MSSQSLPDLAELTTQELQILANTPAGPVPPGTTPDFIHPQTNYGSFYSVSSLLLALSIIFASSRVYQKLWITRKVAIDDLTLLVGFLGTIAYFVACIWGFKYGEYGRHVWDISLLQAASRDVNVPGYLIGVLTSPTMLFIKVTFFIMYLNIFGQWRWMRIAATVGGIITTVFYVAITATMLALLTPRRHEKWLEYTFYQLQQVVIVAMRLRAAQSAAGVAIDLYVLILPIIGVSKLQMPFTRKLGVAIIFMSAILACLGSILGLIYRLRLLKTNDETWLATPCYITTLLELHVGIIVACTPAMNQACRHLFPSYETVRSAISRYHDMRASSVVTSKKSKTNKDTLAGQIELYEGGSAESSHPTRKDLYETSMTVPARSLSSKVFQDSRTATETETSQIINGTRWYK